MQAVRRRGQRWIGIMVQISGKVASNTLGTLHFALYTMLQEVGCRQFTIIRINEGNHVDNTFLNFLDRGHSESYCENR